MSDEVIVPIVIIAIWVAVIWMFVAWNKDEAVPVDEEDEWWRAIK